MLATAASASLANTGSCLRNLRVLIRVTYMAANILGVIGLGFLNQVQTLHRHCCTSCCQSEHDVYTTALSCRHCSSLKPYTPPIVNLYTEHPYLLNRLNRKRTNNPTSPKYSKAQQSPEQPCTPPQETTYESAAARARLRGS